MFKPSDLFDLGQTEHEALFKGCNFAWDALKELKRYVENQVRPALLNHCEGRAYVGDQVYIGEGTILEDGVMIKGPAIIGKNCRIRHNAYFREHVIVGDGCVVGNSCELKHSLLFNECQVPHFSYVGDSIFGHKVHLGAGVKISNVKIVPGNVMVEVDGKPMDTGLRKFGAMLGDHAEVGCNAVLNPGSVVGRGGMIYPLTNWRGVLGEWQIAKNRAEVEVVARDSR